MTQVSLNMVPDRLVRVLQKLMIYWGFSNTTISTLKREWSEKHKLFTEQQFSGAALILVL